MVFLLNPGTVTKRRAIENLSFDRGQQHDISPQISCAVARREDAGLFLTVLLGVSLRRLFTVMSGVSCVSSRRVGVVCALLMMSGVVVLGRFTVMVSSVRMVF